MPSAFYGINLASRALRAFQSGLDITGHNIANANTVGYNRQTVGMANVSGITQIGLQSFMLGAGVDVASVTRARDVFLAMRHQSTQADLSRADAMLGTLQGIETAINEPSTTGVTASLGKLFDAMSALASNPGDHALKGQVQAAGSSLANKLRTLYRDLNGQIETNALAVTQTFDRIDELTTQIADLNLQIRQNSGNGATPNDLLDRRDLLVNELSTLVNINTQPQQDGTVLVSISGFTIVDYDSAKPIPRTYDEATQRITDPTTGASYPITGGKLLGLFQAKQKLTEFQGQLDTLADSLRTEFNALHAAGTNSLGQTGINFFNIGTGALDFDLSAEVLADPEAIATGTSGRDGDNGTMLALANLRETKIAALGNRTFRGFYSDVVTDVARSIQTSKDAFSTQLAVLEQVEAQIQSISGVSLDDEMANMLMYQKSYQAAARVLSIFDQVTEDLINLI